jgi:hypothetical protein
VRAVYRGAFAFVAGLAAEVPNPVGSCLPAHTAARRQSEIIACVPEGAVLRPLGNRRRFRKTGLASPSPTGVRVGFSGHLTQ